jgi:hypothetical protein
VDDVVADGAQDETSETAQSATANDHQTSIVGGAGKHRPCWPLKHITGRNKHPVPELRTLNAGRHNLDGDVMLRTRPVGVGRCRLPVVERR